MNCIKTGELILRLRTEKGMTQKQLADCMNISDKTISKWERGLGCPDVSLLRELSVVLGVNISEMLSGELAENKADSGDINKLKFYVCPSCGNILTATGNAEISCCGRLMTALDAKPCDSEHRLNVQTVEDDFYITFPHEMKKSHYISFVAYAACDRVLMVRLYPEQSAEVRFPKMYGGRLYFCCTRDGLFTE